MASIRQLNANRENAQKSSGPVTDEGKARSRRNSLKHGLSGSGIVLPDEASDALAVRTEEWRPQYQPTTKQGEWFFRQIVACSVIIDACQAHDRTLTEYNALRAELNWDADRGAAVERLAENLPRKPHVIARLLRQTKHGVLWMGGRWAALKKVLDGGKTWSESEQSMALDLLGIPPELRDDPTLLDDPAAVAVREILFIADQLDNALDEVDAFERTATEAGMPTVIGPDVRLVRRYAAACWSRMNFAAIQLKKEAAHEPDDVAPPAPYDPYAGMAPKRVLTEEEFAAGLEYDRSLYMKLMESRAQKAAETAQAAAAASEGVPTAYDMEPVRLRDSLPKASRPMNRKQRRAAERLHKQAR